MEYRKLPRGEERISTLGLGGERLIGLSAKEVVEIFDHAMANGVNILDIYMPEPEVRSNIGLALQGRREKMHIQGHLCATYQDGQYKRTRNLDQSKFAFDDLLTRLKTDYIDFGMIHYVDTEADYAKVLRSGILKYAQDLKNQGIIRHLGFSSHNPIIAQRLIATGDMDLFMFSVNPAYDLDATNNDDVDALTEFKGMSGENLGIAPLRAGLYAESERMGIGITVMKALASGRLLSAQDSPFGAALSVTQCMHYCLTRPAVLSCLLGIHSLDELKEALKYYEASDEEKDFTAIARSPWYAMAGMCVYCNHCLPCPSNIDIAAVFKYLDLATIGEQVPDTVRGHYLVLEANASDCIQCGDCEQNCPFGVEIIEKMEQAQAVFQ
jgi:predicted aldo/keto reductase-like oxidoreductase